ncbi:MAG: DUF89 family protein [Oscillospiraceae bacterium]|nr:DUF89 family protein [Oscillospiraceae bacterium]
MSLGMDAQCMLCHFRRNVETARSMGDEETATAFARSLMQVYLDTPAERATPYVGPAVNELYQRFYGLEPDRYRQEKEESNAFVMARLDAIRATAEKATDPVLAGLQLAILGNYIDFSALQGEVSFEKLDTMLDSAMDMELESYPQLRQELSKAKKLLYLTDNAGEIGFDRICAEQIQKAFPDLQITFCVRGDYAQNDATREDALAVGVPFPVIDNGNDVAGTELSLLSDEAKSAMDAADVIISKGQGNAETLLGCGYNIYYAFLIKCPRFMERYNKPKLTPMLVRERE